MSKKIEARQGLGSAAGLSAPASAGQGMAQPELLAHDLIGSAVTDHAVTLAAVEAVADPALADDVTTVGPLLADTPDWGIGFGNLSTIQDLDYAFLVTGDPDTGGLAVVQASTGAYTVKSDYAVDGYLMSRIVGSAGEYAQGVGGLLDTFHDRKDVTLTGQTIYVAEEASDVRGGAAAEAINGSDGNDVLRGGAGNDNLVGGAGNDIGWGDAGNDGLAGNDGADQLWGGAGLDTLDGGGGNDIVLGGSGADSLTGADGDDVLLGGTDADTINGGAGVDTIIGGAGADSLTGGAGADTFMFMLGDAGLGTTLRDTITDFEVSSDKIDLTGFATSFTITDALVDPKTAYEVLLISTADGTTIKIDSTGDGVTDMEINVITTDHTHLTAGDFVL